MQPLIKGHCPLFLISLKSASFQSHNIMAQFQSFQWCFNAASPNLPFPARTKLWRWQRNAPCSLQLPLWKSGCKCHDGEQEVALARERCPKRSKASNAPKSIAVTDPLDIGPTSGVPPPELCQPNSLDLPPVQTLPDASPKGCALHVLPAQAHSPAEGWLWKLCLPAPGSQGGSWDLNSEENFSLGVVFLNIKQLCLTFKSGGRGDKQKASVHIQIGMLPPLFLGIEIYILPCYNVSLSLTPATVIWSFNYL